MDIVAIFRRWTEILAALYLAWRDSRRELRALVVTREAGHFVIRRSEPMRDAFLCGAGNVLETVSFGAGISAELRGSIHDSFVVFELSDEKVVTRERGSS
jgi:hypothetical protein